MKPQPDAGQTDDDSSVDRVSDGDLAYPPDLTARVLDRWRQAINVPLPIAAELATVLSVCYHATLLREEGRPVTFRHALSEPGAFDDAAGPPSGLHRLVFARPLPLDQHELRRLAPAVDAAATRGNRPVADAPNEYLSIALDT